MKIFISYRRADSRDIVGRICDHLAREHGEQSVFVDVDSISPGDDFRETLERSLRECDVVLCVVGPNWLGKHADGTRRIDSEGDFIRLEVKRSLELKKKIIPILIMGAEPLSPESLPEDIRELAFRHAIQVRPDPDFRNDVKVLMSTVSRVRVEVAPEVLMQPPLASPFQTSYVVSVATTDPANSRSYAEYPATENPMQRLTDALIPGFVRWVASPLYIAFGLVAVRLGIASATMLQSQGFTSTWYGVTFSAVVTGVCAFKLWSMTKEYEQRS